MKKELRHYHLLVAEIAFRYEGSEDINMLRVNGILADADKQIPVSLLNKSQQILQLNFLKKMEGQPPATVLDVVFTNIIYLGRFTKEEFHKVPAGMKLQERVISTEATPESQAGQTTPAPNDPFAMPSKLTFEKSVEGEKN